MSTAALPHKIPSTQLPDLSSTNQVTISPNDILATHALTTYQSIQSSYNDKLDAPFFQHCKRILRAPPTISHHKLIKLLYGIHPLTFPHFIRVQSLSLQQQVTHEISSIPAHFNDFSIFSTQLSNLPALSLLYRQYLQYIKYFQILQKPVFFNDHSLQPAFINYYNRQETQLQQYKSNTEAFSHLFLTKTITPMITSFLTTASLAKPHWLVIAYIPYEKTTQDITAIVSKITGFNMCFVLPPEPVSLTKLAFVSYKTQQNRDNAIVSLNGQLSDHFSVTTNSTKDGNKQPKPPPNIFKLHVFPWVSSQQYEHDIQQQQILFQQEPPSLAQSTPSPAANSSLFSGIRQPVLPVGLKQWSTGPISKFHLMNRIDSLIKQAYLLCQFFDYIRLIPSPTSISTALTHFSAILTSSLDANGEQFKLLKLQLFIKYLREVHLFDFFTTTLYPSKDILVSDIGDEWYILDLPKLSSTQKELIELGISVDSYESIHTTNAPASIAPRKTNTNPNQHKSLELEKKNERNIQAELISSQTTFYSSSLKTIPINPTLSSQNKSLTCFYNAILACSPPQKISQTTPPHPPSPNLPNLSNNSPQLVQYNFWQLQGYYQQLFYPESISSSASSTDTSLINSSSIQLPSFSQDSTIQHSFISTTDNFWNSISTVIETIESMFDPATMQVTQDTSMDSIDPDLLDFASTLSPQSPFYGPSSNASLISTPISPSKIFLPRSYASLLKSVLFSQHFTMRAPNRYQCKQCNKLMISIPTMVKHISTQHIAQNNAILVEFLQNELYHRYTQDKNALSFTPPTLSTPQRTYIENSFVYHKTSSSMENSTKKQQKSRKFDTLQIRYNHNELRTYRRNSLTTDKIDAQWDHVIQMYSTLVEQLYKKGLQLEKTGYCVTAATPTDSTTLVDDESGSHMIVWGAKRPAQGPNKALEEKATQLQKKQKVEKLFKGIDGDNFGKGKITNLEWVSLDNPIPNDHSSNSFNSSKYTTLIQEFLILDLSTTDPPILTYSDIPEEQLHQLSDDFGLEPFVGQ